MRRNFPQKVIKAALKRANGKCEQCGQPTGVRNPPDVHHRKSDWKGGEPTPDNAICLGRKCCHALITAEESTSRAKADRVKRFHLGQKPKSNLSRPRERRPMLEIDVEAKIRRIQAKQADWQKRMKP